MNRAKQVTRAYNQKQMSFTELLIEASAIATAYKQDYENEITCFEYADGSITVFCAIDQSILSYACK